MAVSRVDTRSKRPSPSSQPAATLRSALCAPQNWHTARNLEPPPTDNRFGNSCRYSLHLCESPQYWLKLRETESCRIAISRSQSR
jgi:hypothetical protein